MPRSGGAATAFRYALLVAGWCAATAAAQAPQCFTSVLGPRVVAAGSASEAFLTPGTTISAGAFDASVAGRTLIAVNGSAVYWLRYQLDGAYGPVQGGSFDAWWVVGGVAAAAPIDGDRALRASLR